MRSGQYAALISGQSISDQVRHIAEAKHEIIENLLLGTKKHILARQPFGHLYPQSMNDLAGSMVILVDGFNGIETHF